MYDLNRFTFQDAITCGTALCHHCRFARSLEEVASRAVEYVHDVFRIGPAPEPAFALVQFFRTLPFADLPEDLRELARNALGRAPDSPFWKCLSLIAVVGDRPEWSDRGQYNHLVYPLPPREGFLRAPLIGSLVRRWGLDDRDILEEFPGGWDGHEVLSDGVVQVSHVLGGPFPKAPSGFEHDSETETLLLLGGLLPGNDLFALVLYARGAIAEPVSDQFQALALSLQLAVGDALERGGYQGQIVPGYTEGWFQARSAILERLVELARIQESAQRQASGALRHEVERRAWSAARHAELEAAKEAYLLNERRLTALLKLAEMSGADVRDIAYFAMEEAIQLTRSEIGYLFFTSADEAELTMFAWSEKAMAECAMEDKRLVYPVGESGLLGEAVRQRRPVITNDYSEPCPIKHGLPEGHVPIRRHMNIPVFDGDRIVAVAGVGNKEEDYDESDVRQLRLLMDGMWRLVRRKQTEEELSRYRHNLERLVLEHEQLLESLKLNERRLQALLKFADMLNADLHDIAHFAMEEAVLLTKSQIGYLAFASEDESILTMYAWSKSAMRQCAIQDKPIIYPVAQTGLWGEAVRQRRPVITNDYAAPNPLKKGHPAGHVEMRRHMNVPVFDGDRIVAVAGVGNKEEDYDESDVRQIRLLMDGMWRLIRRQQTDQELAIYRQELERLVAFRTAELSQAKASLEQEMADRKQMEARLIQTEKMASLGILSAGLAHEINNPLAYVANNLVVLERDFKGLNDLVTLIEADHKVLDASCPNLAERITHRAEEVDLPYIQESLERVLNSTRQGVKRVCDIVQNLRGFARLDQAEIDHLDLREAITNSLEMVQGRLERRHIEVVQNLGDVPRVVCSPAQINQVVLNLLINALQAIEATGRGSGRIEISTRLQGDDAIIEIADDGCGIPEEIRSRIFDPFFTTKPVGQGTGLGLSISHSIVADHEGNIEVESTVGQGSRFQVSLPVRGKDHSHEHAAQVDLARGG